MNRRQFIGGMFALAGAAAWAKAGRGAPRLKVGVLSDIHISTPDMFNSQDAIDMFAKTLEFFKKENVDAVIIAGDLTNDGMVKELKAVADTWAKVFGGIDRGPVRVFTTGNHEVVSFNQAKRKKDFSNPRYSEGFALDMRKNWMEIFGEEWRAFFIKKVKGYSFVGAHWAEWNDEKALRGFMDANREALSGKPFFFVQHAHPQDSCYGTWTWHQQDGGPTHKVLADYPNAVAFSGHTHYTITDERSVWRGAFTSLGTGALRWVSLPSGRENGPLNKGQVRRMGNIGWGSQGMVMSVWRDLMVFERYDFVNDGKLGDDWVVPVMNRKTELPEFAFAARRKRSKAPQFPSGAKVTVARRAGKCDKKDENQVVLSFPAAHGADSLSSPFDYEVAIEVPGKAGEAPQKTVTKLVYQPGVQFVRRKHSQKVECVFGECELPEGEYRFTVTPLTSLGVRGRALRLAGI